jgi:hypothetical protein
MAVNDFDEFSSFNISDNGSEVLMSFALTDLIDSNPSDSVPSRFFSEHTDA